MPPTNSSCLRNLRVFAPEKDQGPPPARGGWGHEHDNLAEKSQNPNPEHDNLAEKSHVQSKKHDNLAEKPQKIAPQNPTVAHPTRLRYNMLFHEASLSPPNAAIIIPARFASTRFPGKPLAHHTGKFLIQHVVEQAQKAKNAKHVVVATDDDRIYSAVHSFGGKVVMTSTDHQSGTDRIAEAITDPQLKDTDIIVNVQGDEPEIDPALIDSLITACAAPGTSMATVSAPFQNPADLQNPNIVKVVTDQRGFALNISRSVIPHDRDKSAAHSLYRKHLGLYAYRKDALLTLAKSPVCDLERTEKLEQLRALYLGLKILVLQTDHAPHGIDTPEDYAAFVNRYNSHIAPGLPGVTPRNRVNAPNHQDQQSPETRNR
jgi:3-deoxy-manno-octulosonate cytidylyltransferase (CMP-KDO synthetase)